MHLAIEVLTLLFFAGTAAHAALWRGRAGAGQFAALLWLGFVRENWVALSDLLYGFAPLYLVLGRAPLIATVIWSYSIWAALVWAEAVVRSASARTAVLLVALPLLGIGHAAGLQALKDIFGW